MTQCCNRNFKHRHTPEGIITLHSKEDFEGMRRAGRLAAQVLDFIQPHIKAGITTEAIDQLCHQFILDSGAIPAPLGYLGFPKSVCTSINQVVCHGIPENKHLFSGDIINVDVTVIVEGWHGDTSRTFFVGTPSPQAQKLVDITYDAFVKSIQMVKPGITLGDIGHRIQTIVEKNGFSVVRDYCGHGIGKEFHAAPSVLHFGKPGTGIVLEPGMFLTIEPMVNAGRPETKVLSDGWTVVTKDKSLSAQFEHTLAVTENGFEIFTLSENRSF
ncbi:MAG: type I methionyl aminopeptidase [Holosporales bacterium]